LNVDEESIPYTAFYTPENHYECLRMAFGLSGAPTTFMKAMTIVLNGLIGDICFYHLDDVSTFTKTDVDYLLAALRTIFSRFRAANIRLKLKKCHLICASVPYLGHIVSVEGIFPCPGKVAVIRRYHVPLCPKDIRTFLGLVVYFRKFIAFFAEMAALLTYLTRKWVEF
jgi:hypothetical protein